MFRDYAAVEQYPRIFRKSCKYVLDSVWSKESEYDNHLQGGLIFGTLAAQYASFLKENQFFGAREPPLQPPLCISTYILEKCP